MSESTETSKPNIPTTTALYLALLQFLFNLCWVVYAIYLPKLAVGVGLAAGTVLLILMLDQAIFTVFDTATGVAADRMSRVIGRIGRWVAIVTLISCAAFVALPFITGIGSAGQWLFLTATIVWTVTSSALRAPPIMLLGKYAAKSKLPLLCAIVSVGYGLATAMAPFLALQLRGIDPHIPFIASSVVLVLVTFGLAHVERLIASQRLPGPAPVAPSTGVSKARIVFAVAMVIMALGYQTHFTVNTAPMFRKFSTDIDWLMPVFWIGFNLAMFPATLLVKRWGAFGIMGVFGMLGGLAIIAAESASALNFLLFAQLLAGAAWGCILMSAFTAAFATGENGGEGKMVGVLFSALAFATLLRIGLIHLGWHRDPQIAAILNWVPVACWALGGLMLLALVLVWAQKRPTMATT